MKKFETNKLNRRQYIWSFIDSYLSIFFFFSLTQIIFAPYGTRDYTDVRFYLCLLFSLVLTVWINWYSIIWLIKFVKNKEPMPE